LAKQFCNFIEARNGIDISYYTHILYIFGTKKNLIRKTECYLVEVETKPVEFVAAAPSAIVPLSHYEL
jgi:hypothetical protein